MDYNQGVWKTTSWWAFKELVPKEKYEHEVFSRVNNSDKNRTWSF